MKKGKELKDGGDLLLKPLKQFFNLWLTSGKVPDKWSDFISGIREIK